MENQDLEIVKARMEHGGSDLPLGQTKRSIDSMKYTDVFESWLKDAGPEINDVIAKSYSKSEEWKVTARNLGGADEGGGSEAGGRDRGSECNVTEKEWGNWSHQG